MKKLQPLVTLQNKNLRNLLTGRFLMVLAFRMLASLLGWWIYELTNDPLAIGAIGLSEVIPAVGCALYAGHVIDTNEKKMLLIICAVAYIFLISLLLIPAFNIGHFFTTTRQVPYFIYSVIFFTGIARSFLGPMVPSMLPKLVPAKDLVNAVTLNQGTFLTSSVLGHMIGGLLIAAIDIKGTLVVIVSLLICSLLTYLQLPKQYPEKQATSPDVLRSIKEGIYYIKNTKEVLGAMFLDMFAVLFGGAVAMVPIFAKDILNVGAQGYGLLNAAADIGSMIIIVTLSFIPLKRNQGKILLIAVAGFGACIIGFGLSNWFWLSFFLLMLSGLLDGISVVIRGTIVQLKTPEHLRGRVMSVNTIFIMSSNEMGQFESGVMAKLLGPVKSVVVGGTLTILTALTIGKLFKPLRKLEY